MPICFLCQESLLTTNALFFHFEYSHRCEEIPYYKCIDNECNRKFGNSVLLRKHYASYHKFPRNLPANFQVPILTLESFDLLTEHSNDENNSIHNEDSEDTFIVESDNEIEETNINDNLPNLLEIIEHEASLFIAKLYANPSLPRKHVQMVIDDLNHLFAILSPLLKSGTSQMLENQDPQITSDINSLLSSIFSPFSNLSTEYRRLKFFAENGFLIPAVDYVIGRRTDEIRINQVLTNVPVEVCVKFIPTRKILKAFLELPGILSIILQYMNSLKTEDRILENFVQGQTWREKRSNYGENDIVLPISVHLDDLEVNNPLGPHAGVQKLCPAYISLLCLPPEFASALDNIFVTLMFHSSDRDEFGNAKVFRCLVDELNYLIETGILVRTESGDEIRIYFVFAGILSDNQGYNVMLGFVKGFNANRYCRFCKNLKRDCQHNTINRDNLRRKETYLTDVAKGSELTGIVENSIWNEVKYFHVIENYFVDILHDLDEGVSKYDMKHILHHYIIVKCYFSVDLLNSRILGFDYSKKSLSNRPPAISQDDVKKKHLSLSGSEMRNLVLTFAMLVGDRVPLDDDVWQLYLILRRIYDLAYAKVIQKAASGLLGSLVREHNSLYLQLFDDTLKPKHHFLEHYPSILLKSGPFSYYSSSKYETKHNEPKKSANATKSRRNITHTLLLKQQLKVCYRIIRNEGFKLSLNTGRELFHGVISDCRDYQSFVDDLPAEFETCSVISWVDFKGTLYKENSCVVIDTSEDLPVFGIVSFVLINEFNQICLVCEKLETKNLNIHLHAYSVIINRNSLVCIRIENLSDIFPVIFDRSATGEAFVTLKHAL